MKGDNIVLLDDPKPEFEGFPKIPRYSRECMITEKIDGTNGQIYIPDDSSQASDDILAQGYPFYVGSRSRWITPENDNHGFAKWAYENATELLKLGPGRHFGEWWGQSINRGYGLKEKRFSLFNVKRWNSNPDRPTCCSVVPMIAYGEFGTDIVQEALRLLQFNGSYAAPGFMQPEGIIIYHTAGNLLFKKTITHDEEPKGKEK